MPRRFGRTTLGGALRAILPPMAALGLAAGAALAQGGGVVSLRGEVGLDETNAPAAAAPQSKPANGFGRAYRQQPPLIPHRVDGYQVTRAFNKCLSCHGWPQNAKFGAPKVSETHFSTREGVRVDEISGGRWFCTQCHVPQDDARPLVGNAFKNAREVGGAFK